MTPGLSIGAGWWFPPLHPILVNFTAALVPVSFACDLLGAWTKRESLRSAGAWTMLFAALITPFTAVAGWLWLRSLGDDANPWPMPIHQWLGTAFAVLLLPLAFWRGTMFRRAMPPGTAYLIVLALAVAGLVVQGDLGGRMSFGSQPDNDSTAHGAAAVTPAAPAPSAKARAPDDQHQWRDHIDLPSTRPKS